MLGGSVFLGRAVVRRGGRAPGADVTVFNRGVVRAGARRRRRTSSATGPSPPTSPSCAGRRFDVVVDTCGYVPADVAAQREPARPTRAATTRSSRRSTSIPAGRRPPTTTHARRRTTATRTRLATTSRTSSTRGRPYGWLKVGCERAVAARVRRGPVRDPARRARSSARTTGGRPAAVVDRPGGPRRRGARARARRPTRSR